MLDAVERDQDDRAFSPMPDDECTLDVSSI